MMSKVAIITDSIACLTKEQAEHYEIRIVPANILFEGKVYRDWVDISPSEAYRLLERAPDQFTTSPASPTEYLEAYRELSREAESILCITISSKLSAFHDMARLAKEQAKQEFPQTTIEVLDSRTATAAQGLIVLAAARAAAEGKSLAGVIKAAETLIGKVTVIMVMETIRYVYRTGRIPKVAARIGSTLNVKPIITISDGVVHPAAIARTKQRGVDRLLQMMRDKVGANSVHVAVMHADALEEAERLKERVSSEFNCIELWLSEFSPIMGYATGPGLLGLAFYAEA
ncbi:MAG: DegV family protein [Dehalococcoidia bacterium]|nr:MAG: DegV family protein [Dehalococcoidia bacterium]